MKKVYLVLIALLMLVMMCTPAVSAADEYETAGDLYQAWFEINGYDNPYPSYVCGVWSMDGTMNNLVIAVTEDEAGEAGKQEILEQIADDSSVQFTYLRYAYSELRGIQAEIEQYMGQDNGVNACGVDEMHNVVCISIDTNNANSEAFMSQMAGRYGDKVVFELMDGAIVTTEDIAAADENQFPIWILGVAGIVILAGAFLLIRKKTAN